MYDDPEYLAANNPAYDVEHLSRLLAKDKYFDVLSDSGYDVVELISEGGDTFVGYEVGGCIYNIDDEIKSIVQ